MNQSSEQCGSILKKMALIMADVDRIEKDRQNQHGNYKYASEKVIKEVMHVVMLKHGVVLQISSSNADALAGKGNDAVCMSLDVYYRFYDIDSEQWLAGQVVGSGNPRDDKGIYAALTGAIKYILTSNFLIPTGDDPESNFFDRYLGEEQDAKKEPVQASTPVAAPAADGKGKKEPGSSPGLDKAEAAKQADRTVPAASVKLTEDQQNVIILAFEEQAGIEIWELEKIAGDHRRWTMEDRRELLKKFNALTDKKKGYSKENFLAGDPAP